MQVTAIFGAHGGWVVMVAPDGTTALIADLKRRNGGDIGIRGSLSLARALLTEHLVDELRLVLAPSLAGHGKRLIDG